MPTAVCPGSFDPVTFGHLDIVSRAVQLFDHVTIAVLHNPGKQALFSVDERIAMLAEATTDLASVTVEAFEGLLVDFCRARGITVIAKGLRAAGDFDYELQMAQMNSRLANLETVFVPTSPQWSFVASSLVKEVAAHGEDVSGLVPEPVVTLLRGRLGR